jgi:succinyl-diaminopimelate desuccinylase
LPLGRSLTKAKEIVVTNSRAPASAAIDGSTREILAIRVKERRRETVEIAKRLLAIPSPNPPGDTRALAAEIASLLKATPGIDVELYSSAEPILNLVAIVRGARPGRRIIFNGHLDTFPLGNAQAWTTAPNGEERDGRLYGLGISDMKGGLAASIFALQHLAAVKAELPGEVVATFAGDEETMGVLGAKFLLDTVPHARGDAMISGDAGSPRVLRFGEKGMIWMKLVAKGRSSHAAHVHRGDSAIEKLIVVVQELSMLRDYKVESPPAVLDAIRSAAEVSEGLSGAGESDVLRKVTITFGTFHGGRLSNLVADHAEATADVRLPVGITVGEIEHQVRNVLTKHPDVNLEITRRYEPSWTDPDHEIIRVLRRNCHAVLGQSPVVNMRVGASDARLYRAAGVPTVVCGLTPNNMGAADENVEIIELQSLGEIFTLSAYDFLGGSTSNGKS